jgi:hypothetical protein
VRAGNAWGTHVEFQCCRYVLGLPPYGPAAPTHLRVGYGRAVLAALHSQVDRGVRFVRAVLLPARRAIDLPFVQIAAPMKILLFAAVSARWSEPLGLRLRRRGPPTIRTV